MGGISSILAILTGLTMGYILERGDLCFHSTMRGLFRRPQELDLFRAYLLALLVATPLVTFLQVVGLIEPWVPPFAWSANLVGGLVFGIGMVIAASCVTGLFYKLGHGMLGTAVGLAGWALGDIITYQGPLAGLRDTLNAEPLLVNGESATLTNSLGTAGWLLWLILAAAGLFYLYRSPRCGREKRWDWLPLGLAVGIFTSLAWLLADAGGSDYTFGTSGVPADVYDALLGRRAGGSLWIPLALVGLVPGAFIAAYRSGTLWIRGESGQRYAALGLGGLVMGVGAGIAGGCNLGHSLVGVPLLSLGSMTTTLSMGLGVFLAHKISRFGFAHL